MTDLDEMPGHLIRRLNQISVSLFTNHMSEAGIDLTPVQFAALVTLEESPSIDQATLAGLIANDRVTIGGVVDRLVAKGLVHREVSALDRRARVLELSPLGKETLGRALPVAVVVQSEILAGLSDQERDSFSTLLRKATEAGNNQSRAPQIVPAERQGQSM